MPFVNLIGLHFGRSLNSIIETLLMSTAAWGCVIVWYSPGESVVAGISSSLMMAKDE